MTDRLSTRVYRGVFRDGTVHILGDPPWTQGCHVEIRAVSDEAAGPMDAHPDLVIIAGFGLAGRWSAEAFERFGIEYVIVEKNPITVNLQKALGRHVIQGDIADEATLRAAGIERAGLLALAIPDERAVLQATQIARRLNPDIYIIARTNYTSKGMQASRLGANAVVKAEQAVADRFYQLLMHRLGIDRGVEERIANSE